MAKTFIHNSTHQSCNKMLCNFFCFIFVVSVPVPIFACVEQLALFDGLLLCLNYFKIELSSLWGGCLFKNLAF